MDILTFIMVIVTIVILTYKVRSQGVSMRTLVWPYLLLTGLFIVMYPPILRFVTKLFGFTNTENFIFFVLCGYLILITIVQEVRIAKLNDKLNSLARELSLTNKEQDDNTNNSSM